MPDKPYREWSEERKAARRAWLNKYRRKLRNKVPAAVRRRRYAKAMAPTCAKMRAARGVRDWTPAEVERLKRLVKAGVSEGKIAAKLGRTARAVNIKKSRLGLKSGTKIRTSDEERELLRKLARDDKLPLYEMAEITGIHANTIDAYLQREGISRVSHEEWVDRKRATNFVRGWLEAPFDNSAVD